MPVPATGDTAEDSKPEHHVPLGDQLEQHLRTLTDLYQNQVLLQMQKAMSKAGIIHRDESGSRNRL